jgi:hypothetical protein
MFRNAIHTFKGTTDTGLDQVPLNGIIQIIDADTTSTNKVGFLQLTDKTGISATTTIGELLDGSVGAFKDIVDADQAGRLYNPEEKYAVGDIVTKVTGTVTLPYICTTAISTPEPWDPSKWKELAEDSEYRGRIWSNTKNYKIGDVVAAAPSANDYQLYIAITDNTNIDPLANPTDWKQLGTDEYTVGTFTPTSGAPGYGSSEYPDSTTPGNPPEFTGAPGAILHCNGCGS